MIQSKQSDQEMAHNGRQLVHPQAKFGALQVKKNQMLEKEQENLFVLLADCDSQIKVYKCLLIEKDIQLHESEEEEEDSDESEDKNRSRHSLCKVMH